MLIELSQSNWYWCTNLRYIFFLSHSTIFTALSCPAAHSSSYWSVTNNVSFYPECVPPFFFLLTHVTDMERRRERERDSVTTNWLGGEEEHDLALSWSNEWIARGTEYQLKHERREGTCKRKERKQSPPYQCVRNMCSFLIRSEWWMASPMDGWEGEDERKRKRNDTTHNCLSVDASTSPPSLDYPFSLSVMCH